MDAPRAVVSAALHARFGCDKTAGARPVVAHAFAYVGHPEPDSLPTLSLQQSPCLPACSSCHTGSCAEKRASCGVWSTGPLHPSAARQPVPSRSAGPASLCTHGTHCGQVRMRGCNLTGKGCTVCAAARNLGSFVLDDVLRRRKIRAQGCMLLDGGSMHGLDHRNNALSDRMDRASSSSFPESSAARFCDFSSHFMALATHTSLSLASHSTTACNSVFTESLLLINSSVDFFDPELSCCFCCTCCHRPPHALSGQSRPHSTQTSPSSP